MNIYRMLGIRFGTREARQLGERLSAWHDAMVAHERRDRIRDCSDECPHGEAGLLWAEARETFGADADELSFLRSRGAGAGSRRHVPELRA
jgi:hypothetical protein